MNLITPLVVFAVMVFLAGTKWQIKSKTLFIWICVISLLYVIVVGLLSRYAPNLPTFTIGMIGFLQSFVITASCLLACFFRDPERVSPELRNSILSPADGKIIYIKKIDKDEFPFAVKKRHHIPLTELIQNDFIVSGGYQIGISMNFLNVHVNRAPISGKVTYLKKIPGKFKSLRHVKSLLENERVCTVIKGEKLDVCVVQIASRLVRRIITYIEMGHRVVSGQRIGMICFGSQVDLLLPYDPGVEILVKENDEVKACLSVIARY